MSKKEPEPKTINAAPARVVRELVAETIHWYLPESQRDRFLKIGDDYSYLDSHRWESVYQMAMAKLRRCLETMKGWLDRPETDELLDSWDDEVFFFYVLRFQFILVHLHSLADEDWVPYGLDEFWDWAMVPGDHESWVFYTFPTVVKFDKLSQKPPIWKFFAPTGVAISK